ncbi:phage tail sheath family protein [Bacillus sp. B-jedd]|uniref:phage tail sheath family protein n=1 Tax=Bacillus sp. B-jedd TaxID=1476857 RepID=UPI00051561CA|nr:phage tail sheath family protein [Bacillus sp. B-jedd]CEG29798.1 Phage tail sheath protein [Bacillus sp. B-jedd]
MGYKHGVYSYEPSDGSSSLISPITATAGLKVVVGTAPINLAKSTEYVNKPFLAKNFNEAVEALGYSYDWDHYTLCEDMDASFRLYGIGPVVFINVLDPSIHKTEEKKEINIINKKAAIEDKGILLDSLSVKLAEIDEQPLVKGKDYTASFDEIGQVIIAAIPGGAIPANQTTFSTSYTRLDPSMVTDTDIIGGIDVNTGAASGLELINSVFPIFGLVPGQVLAPGFSENPTVAAIMKAKANNINSFFKAMSVEDVDSGEANIYTKVADWKTKNQYNSSNEIPCWPKVALNDKVYHLSTHASCAMALVDSQNDDMPFVSPSNKPIHINKTVLKDGREVNLGPEQANYLNGQGILTALNFIGGWKAWGNRTGAYPENTNVKDSFIPVRRMHNWISNSIILTTWEKVDDPTNNTLIDTVVDSLNMWLNGLVSTGALLGGRVEFRQDENPITDLLNGTVRFHVFLAEPTPGENFEFIVEFDATYYNRLFQ